MNLIDLLQGQLSGGLVDQLSQQIGGADREQTATAAQGIITTLVSQLARNASTPEGAQSLNNALERDHDGSILDNLSDVLTGNVQPQNQSTVNGLGILNHVLGDRQGGVANMVSQMSGLESGKTMQLMGLLAPVVMGMLGKAKNQNGLDIGGIANLLNGTVNQQQQSGNPTLNMITRFLDSDGDGSALDDIANMGMKILGGLFKKYVSVTGLCCLFIILQITYNR
ncbi:MAG: DUF937 domain-containing protein [Saprospiraceae bacterium]|nr:DUF937 domain-containing protein [Saprospiraceae bacterium]